MRGGIILRQILIVLISLDISLGGCAQEDANYPPPDKTVVLDSTNLPIVFLNVGGDSEKWKNHRQDENY